MQSMIKILLIPVVLALMIAQLVIVQSAFADDDHYRARAALETGEILPLSAILASIPERFSGTLIDVELERDDGLWVYELELRNSKGWLIELEINAANGTILEMEKDID